MKRILQFILIAVLLKGTALAQGTTPPSPQISISPTWFRTSTVDSNFYAKIGASTWYRFPTWEKVNGIFGNYYSKTVSDARFIKQSDSVLKYVTPRRLLDTARTKQSYQNVIYHKSYWTGLTDFTVSGTGATISSTNSILLNNTRIGVTESNSNDEFVDIKIQFVLTASSTAGGITVGRRTSVGGFSEYATWTPTTNTLITAQNSPTGTVSSIIVPFSNNVGDIMELTFSQRSGKVIATLVNRSYDQTATVSFDSFPLNMGMMSVWATTGTLVDVRDIRTTSLAPRNPNIIFVGDSKTAYPVNYNYPKYLDDYGPIGVFAGPSEMATQLSGQIQYILKYIKPESILLNIGRNDVVNSVPSATWQAAYISFVSQMTAAGIHVYHMLPIPETAFTGQAPIASFITSTYSAADIIDPSIGWDNAKYLQPDGIHPNEAGARFLANLVKSSGKFTKRSYMHPDNDFKSFLLSDAVNTGKTIGANTTGNSATSTTSTSTAAVSGTTNRVAKFTSTSTVGNSLIYENGINIGFGTPSPAKMLDVEKDDDYQMRLGNAGGQYYDLGRDQSTGYFAIYGSQSGFNGYIFKGVDRTFLTIANSGSITQPAGTFTAPTLNVSAAPTTSAGTYDLLTRNTATGVVEKIAPSALGNQVVEITGTSQTGAINTINIPHNAALTTISVPSTTVIGSLFQVVGEGAGGWKITLPAGFVAKGVGVSTSTAGSISSTDRYCTITLRLAAPNTFVITSSQGTLSPL